MDEEKKYNSNKTPKSVKKAEYMKLTEEEDDDVVSSSEKKILLILIILIVLIVIIQNMYQKMEIKLIYQ